MRQACLAVLAVLGISSFLPPASLAGPIGTAFTYQGRLKAGDNLIDGPTDLKFSLWDDASNADPNHQVGHTIVFQGSDPNAQFGSVDVQRGLFEAPLDFGAAAFNGQERWLDVQLRYPAGSGSYTSLGSRQKLTSTPYALYAPTASALSAPDGSPAQAVIVDPNGFVGIGTTSPGFLLDVAGRARLRASGGDTAGIWFRNNAGTADSAFIGRTDPNATGLYAGSWRLVVLDSGNVGIGTSNPEAKLDVNGTAQMTGFKLSASPSSGRVLTSDATGNGTWQPALSLAGNGSATTASRSNHWHNQLWDPNGANLGVAVIAGGNVGVGTTAPKALLEVDGSTSNSPPALRLRRADNHLLFVSTDVSGHAAGVSFGNAAGAAPTGALTFQHRDPNGAFLGNVFTIRNDGGVGVGVLNPSATFAVNGTACGTSAWTICSDARFKTNVVPAADGLDRVMKLRPVRFDWRCAEFPNRQFEPGRQIGFIAQEVEPILPELVRVGTDGYYSLNYEGISTVLTAAVQELHQAQDDGEARLAGHEADIRTLQARTDRLERQNAELRAENEALQARIERLEALVGQMAAPRGPVRTGVADTR